MIEFIKKFPIKFNPSSVVIAILLPAVVLLQLPGVVIDVFIIISFISSTLLLVVMLENDDPLKVTFLPTIILLLTTFRLLLSIATTRNIIANEDVGGVIETIGQFVMGGNLISGLLIFVIITIVQFLVVTKGGERVAEVGARFSLDALPGRQMTIDGDLKAGLITGEDAQRLRAELNTENRMFGSLDGAMKFVKGDSIAGILISLVNLFGGIYVGINQFELSLSESVNKFSILTIGDGLVSQIPSLLLSMACGVYLTRIKSDEEKPQPFISQLTNQLRSFWKSMLIISGIIFLLGIINSDLFWVCVFLSTGSLLFAFYLKQGAVTNNSLSEVSTDTGSGLYESVKFVVSDQYLTQTIKNSVIKTEKCLWGQKIGQPAVKVDPESDYDLIVYISGVRAFSFSQERSESGAIEILEDEIFPFEDEIEINIDNIAMYFLKLRLIDKYNLTYTNSIIEELGLKSEVMKNEINSAIGLNRVHDIIKEKLQFSDFEIDKISFFESLIYWSRIESDPENWFIRIRSQAKYEITSSLVNKEGKIYIALIPQDLLERMHILSNPSEDVEGTIMLKQAIRNRLIAMTKEYKTKPVLVVSDDEVKLVKSLLHNVITTANVCSYNDIVDQDLIASTQPISIDF
ncbi:FHIPEP family type III secretion protein [Vibrio coralliilyticus]|uniref:FHIPEP family type III secretion protein n=1 Tax=Vibrio coralliilyticus TaxID=190893 RepID=UPI00185A603B|nr:FHIPEP family type III secretion protein [Vibrio coralliilyticus]NUW68063.1 FHIPEP family type III secretion protein [Vibrio coralliilyticus]